MCNKQFNTIQEATKYAEEHYKTSGYTIKFCKDCFAYHVYSKGVMEYGNQRV